jgi:poly(3-hydroxybutyrate) depolymerase
MLSAVVFFLLALAPFIVAEKSEGCKDMADPDEFKGLPSDLSLPFEGRDVWVSFPPGYRTSKPASLIIAFHDRDMTAKDMQKVTLFSNSQVNSRAIILYPSTKDVRSIETLTFKVCAILTVSQEHWMTDPKSLFEPKEDSWDSDGDDPTNDIFYTARLIKHFETKYCINSRRIYAVGLGQGGGMMHQLACQPQMSRKIAAFAAVGGAFYKPKDKDDHFWGNCRIGRRPIPILEIHGDQDKEYPLVTIKKKEYKDLMPITDWISEWRDLNSCGNVKGKPKISKTSDTTILTELESGQRSESLVFGGGAIKESYRCGIWQDRKNDDFDAEEKDRWRVSVVHYVIRGFKHGWPRIKVEERDEVEFKGKKVKPIGNPSIDASSIVLNFFNHHRLPDKQTVQGQARRLLLERGAPVRDGKTLPKNIPRHGEL